MKDNDDLVLEEDEDDEDEWPYKLVRPISEISEFQYLNDMRSTFIDDENFIERPEKF